MSRFGEALHGGPVDAVEIARVREVIMFEEPALRERLVRFWGAAYPGIGDRHLRPVRRLGRDRHRRHDRRAAHAADHGPGIRHQHRRTARDPEFVLVGIGGIATAIGVGYLLSFLMPSVSTHTNVGQIMARTTPRLIDLLAALATGLAGAFAIGRRDVSDTLPGVAIAISLVPPLANVGILLGAGRPDLALAACCCS